MSKTLICNNCGSTTWTTGPGRILASNPPISVEEYICAHCGAIKEVTRERVFPSPTEIVIGDNDTVSDARRITADGGPSLAVGNFTADLSKVFTGTISTDAHEGPKKQK